MSGPFKMRSGNATPFKKMGSSPAKHPPIEESGGHKKYENEKEHTEFHDYQKGASVREKEDDVAAHVTEGTVKSQELRRKQQEELEKEKKPK